MTSVDRDERIKAARFRIHAKYSIVWDCILFYR